MTYFFGISLALTLAHPAHAQTYQVPTKYQYSAKSLCTLLGNFGFGDALAPGRYRTVINIHNPHDNKIEIARKFALAGAPQEPAGEFSVTPYKVITLGPDQAISYNCFDIAGFYCPIRGVCVDFTAIDGFLVVNSPVQLDVVSVYTAHPQDSQVSTLDTETVAERAIKKVIKILPEETPQQPAKRIQIDPYKKRNTQ